MKNIIALLILSSGGYSQEKEIGDSLKTYELEGTTVTATRTREAIIEVPLAVTVLSRKQIETVGTFGLSESMRFVPGVLSQSRSGGQDVRLSIRGFGARGAGDRSNAGSSRGVRVVVDGLPMTEPDGRTSFDLIDMNMAESVEIVRSNASSVWGNAGGGIITINTVPSFDESFATVRSTNGSFGLHDHSIRIGTAVGMSKFYAGFTQSSFDGWRENSKSERQSVTLGMFSRLAPLTTLGVHVIGAHSLFYIPGPLTQQQYDSSSQQANPAYLQQRERRNNRQAYFGLTLEHGFNESNRVSAMTFVNPKVLHRSERNSYRDFTRYHLGGNVMVRHIHSLGGKLINISLIGADEAYQDGAILFYGLGSDGNRLYGTPTQDKKEGANNLGFFFQNELQIGETWSLLAGLRYDDVTYHSQNFLAAKPGYKSKSFTHLTPKAGVNYRLSSLHSVYANLGGGVEVPAGNETDPSNTAGLQSDTTFAFNPLLKPITSVTIEAGTKHIVEFSGVPALRNLSYDAAVYLITVKNDIVPYRSGRFYLTAGKTRRMGFEWASHLGLDHGISLGTSVTISKNAYVKYLIDSTFISTGSAGKTTDYKDNKMAGVPGTFYALSVRYEPSLLKGVYIEAGLQGVGKYFADDANTVKVPAYTVVNASIGLSKPVKLGGKIFLKGYVSANNLTDKKYPGSSFINPDRIAGQPAGRDVLFLEAGLPRNFAVSVSLSRM